MTEPLRVQGDVQFSVDGPRGSTYGTVSGRGSTITVHAQDPVLAWDGALGSTGTGPGALREVARLLSDQGLTLEVTGPAGRVASVGSGVTSPLGAVLTGSRRVRLGRPAAVRPLAVAWLRDRADRRVALTALAAGAALLAARWWAGRGRGRR